MVIEIVLSEKQNRKGEIGKEAGAPHGCSLFWKEWSSHRLLLESLYFFFSNIYYFVLHTSTCSHIKQHQGSKEGCVYCTGFVYVIVFVHTHQLSPWTLKPSEPSTNSLVFQTPKKLPLHCVFCRPRALLTSHFFPFFLCKVTCLSAFFEIPPIVCQCLYFGVRNPLTYILYYLSSYAV